MEKWIKDIEYWYQQNKRNLPWRIDQDPYHIWISEIMLQQTRIEAVINYYKKFMEEIPSISFLADIEEDKLLKLWEGLGYYSRARNLKKAAQMIQNEYHGVFPTTYQELVKLPGIGDYTASAISSICFNEKQATIDGNVLRVYTRLKNDFSNIDLLNTKKRIQKEIINKLPVNSGAFNEALMELGETICIPNGTPQCEICPIKKYCIAYAKNTYSELPKRNPKIEKKELEYTVLLFKKDNQFIIQKREQPGILTKMWEFPNVEGHLTIKKIKNYLEEFYSLSLDKIKIKKSISTTHIFTHQKWKMISYIIEVEDLPNKIWKTEEEIIEEYAIPTAFQPFIKVLKEK